MRVQLNLFYFGKIDKKNRLNKLKLKKFRFFMHVFKEKNVSVIFCRKLLSKIFYKW